MEETKTTITKEELDQRLRKWAHSILNAAEAFSLLSESLAKKYGSEEEANSYAQQAEDLSKHLEIARKRIEEKGSSRGIYNFYSILQFEEEGITNYLQKLVTLLAYGKYGSRYDEYMKEVSKIRHVNVSMPLFEGKEYAYSSLNELFHDWANSILFSIEARALLCTCLASLGGNEEQYKKWDRWAKDTLSKINSAQESVYKTKDTKCLASVYEAFAKEEVEYINYQNKILLSLSSNEYYCMVTSDAGAKEEKSSDQA